MLQEKIRVIEIEIIYGITCEFVFLNLYDYIYVIHSFMIPLHHSHFSLHKAFCSEKLVLFELRRAA